MNQQMKKVKSSLEKLKELYDFIEIDFYKFFPHSELLPNSRKQKFSPRKIKFHEIQSYSVNEIETRFNNFSQPEFLRKSYGIIKEIKWNPMAWDGPNWDYLLKSTELQIRDIIKYLKETELTLFKKINEQINDNFPEKEPEGNLNENEDYIETDFEQLQPVIDFVIKNETHLELLTSKCQAYIKLMKANYKTLGKNFDLRSERSEHKEQFGGTKLKEAPLGIVGFCWNKYRSV